MSDVDGDQLLNMSELGAFIEMVEEFEEEHHEITAEEVMEHFDANNDSHISWDEFWNGWVIDEDDHDEHDEHDDDNGTDDGHDHDDEHDDHHDEEEVLMEMFNMSDVDGDQLLNMSELGAFIELLEDGHDDHHDDHEEDDGMVGYATIHIEEEGEYGFALPMDVELFILMGEGGHNDHGHDGHDGHDDHHEGACHNTTTHENYDSNEADCEAAGHMWMDDHSEQEIIAIEDEEFDFDPHSWLDPLAFKAQVGVVLDALIVTFPSGEAAFTENAAAYMAQLDSLHLDFDSAFGSTNTCTGTSIAANHNAYAYMAERYDLEFVTVHGLDPEGEPSAADILEVIERIEEEGITVFFVEEYTSQAAVSAILEQTNGIEIETLYTMELQPSDSEDDYISMMRKNLEGLKSGLGC